jgi:hypothetical protein
MGLNKILAPVLAVAAVVVILYGGMSISGGFVRMGSPLPCMSADYTIDSAKWDAGSMDLVVRVVNEGTTELYGFGAVINGELTLGSNAGEIVTVPTITGSSPLRQGRSAYIRVMLAGRGITPESVRITNIPCPSVSAEVKKIEAL